MFIVDAVLLMLLLGAVRMSRRLLAELPRRHPGKRVLIFGAGDAGELIVRDMKNSAWYGYHPVGFVDDDQSKVGHADPWRAGAGHARRPATILRAIPPGRSPAGDSARRAGGDSRHRPRARAVQGADQDAAERCAT